MNRKAILSVISVLVLGMVLGGLGVYAYMENTHAGERGKRGSSDVVAKLTAELSLSPAQQEQLRALRAESKSRYDAVYESIKPQTDEIRRQGRDQIRAILTPEQLARFEAYLRNLDEQRRIADEQRKGRSR